MPTGDQLIWESIIRDKDGEIGKLRNALEFYADPAKWMKDRGITDEQIPDFYSETNFAERAIKALNG